jgi:hypothetical protein
MRSFITLGVVSLVGVAGMFACGDDETTDRPSAIGGSGGVAGTGGTGGAAAGTGGAATGGTGGGAAGTGGAPTVPTANCTGCVQLTVGIPATPVAPATMSQAGFIFSAPATAVPFDLSDVTTITWRVQSLTPNAAYFVQPFVQTAPPEDPNYSFGFYPAQVALSAAAFAPGAWVDVALDVGAIGAAAGGLDAGADAAVAVVDAGASDAGTTILTAFDKSKTRTIGLNVGALPTSGAGLVSVEVDSVTVAGTSNFTSKTFTANAEGLTLNMYQVPPGTPAAPAFH